MDIVFSNKVSAAFITKVISVSEKLGINPNWLMYIMYFETGGTFSPSIQNDDTKATGLIQFIPSTANWLGTSIEALKVMSALDQLDYVYEYLRRMQNTYGRFASYHDLYLAVFYPESISENETYIMGIERGDEYARKLARQNQGFDVNRDAYVTKKEVMDWLDTKAYKVIPSYMYDEFFKKKVSFNFTKKKLYCLQELRLAS